MRVFVADHLRSLILSRQLLPGERLVQGELADKLGVSRTPIREALQDLASEGLVAFSSYKGASVAEPSLSDVEEIYAVRTALESYAGFLAAERITEDELEQLEALIHEMEVALEARADTSELMDLNHRFNSTIYAASRQELLCDQAVRFMHLADMYRRIHFSVEQLAAEALAEHRQLLAALRKGDPEAVEKLTRIQVQRSVSSLREFINRTPEKAGVLV